MTFVASVALRDFLCRVPAFAGMTEALALTLRMSMPIILTTSRSAARRVVDGHQKIPRGRDSFKDERRRSNPPETLRQKDRVGR